MDMLNEYYHKNNSNIEGIDSLSKVYKTTRERIIKHIDVNDNIKENMKTAAADLYFLYYSSLSYVKNEKNNDDFLENIRNSMINLVKTDKFAKERIDSRLDDKISMLYSINFIKQLNENIKKNIEKNQNSGKENTDKMINDAMSAASRKMETADKIEKLMKTNEPGGRLANKDDVTLDKLIDLTDRVLNVENADKIISTANKLFDIMPKFTKRMKTRSNTGEISGYYKTLHISNVLSRELAMPDEIFYSKIINGFTGKEKMVLSEGSYYVLLDKSGSMYEGDKTIWSRSVALALFKIARMKKRKYFLRFFDNKPHELLDKPYDIINSILTIEANKGTCLEGALRTAINDLKSTKLYSMTNTLIVITDGEDKINTDNIIKDMSKIDINIISVMINGYNEGLKKISKKYLNAKLNEDGALKLLNIAKSL